MWPFVRLITPVDRCPSGVCRFDGDDVLVVAAAPFFETTAVLSFLGRGIGLPSGPRGRGSRAFRGFFSFGLSSLAAVLFVDSALRLRGGLVVDASFGGGCDVPELKVGWDLDESATPPSLASIGSPGGNLELSAASCGGRDG